MAQLTLAERSAMAGKSTFQARIITAAKKKANYWKDSQLPGSRTEIYKRKKFAESILTGNFAFPITAFAEYLLMQYNEETPDLDGNGELSDAVLTGHASMDVAYDYFAGIKPNEVFDPENP